jgi:hypothetical protein
MKVAEDGRTASEAKSIVESRFPIRAIMNYTKGVENDKRNI